MMEPLPWGTAKETKQVWSNTAMCYFQGSSEPPGCFAKLYPAGVMCFPQPMALGCPGHPAFSGIIFNTSLVSHFCVYPCRPSLQAGAAWLLPEQLQLVSLHPGLRSACPNEGHPENGAGPFSLLVHSPSHKAMGSEAAFLADRCERKQPSAGAGISRKGKSGWRASLEGGKLQSVITF